MVTATLGCARDSSANFVNVREASAVRLYAAHMAMRQVDWSIRNHTADHVAYVLKTADRMLHYLTFLTRLSFWAPGSLLYKRNSKVAISVA